MAVRTGPVLVSSVLAAVLVLGGQQAGHAQQEAAAPDAGETTEAPPRSGPRTIRVGVEFAKVSKLDLGEETYHGELWVSLSWPEEDGPYRSPLMGELAFPNARTTQVEVLYERPGFRSLQVKGDFVGRVDLEPFPFDTQSLVVVVQDATANSEEVLLAVDKETTGIDVDHIRLPGWAIGKVEAKVEQVAWEADKGQKFSTATFQVPIRRLRLASGLKFLMPVLFLVLVSSLALLLRVESAITRVSMGTATLLASVMFHLSYTTAIPPVWAT